MFNKLHSLKERYEFLTKQISDSQIIARQDEWTKLVKEHSSLQPIVEAYDEWKKTDEQLVEALFLVQTEKEKEMAELMQMEIDSLKESKHSIENQLKVLLLPKDPKDDSNVIIEVRAGAGGDEAALFASQMHRMYCRYAERSKWKIEEIDLNESELGGVKEATFSIIGKGAYSKLKFESGVHRVQRVPATESQGRIHTSTITVAVLPEVEDVDVTIDEKDLKIDTYRSGGAGGQHVNKTESAIRITHLPTGMVVACQDERSQVKNKDKAMKTLKSKMYDFLQQKAEKEYAKERKMQVGTGDRSERIRTYNFPQGRVTDHRIGFTVFSIEAFMDGDIAELLEQLSIADQTAKLQGTSEQ